MSKAIIYTDTSDIKRDAIEGVFKAKFKIVHTINSESFGGKTPLNLDDLILDTKSRLLLVSKKVLLAGEYDYHATIQRGFHFTGTLWHLMARVGISSYFGKMATAFTSSVPIPLTVSNTKTQDRERNLKDILKDNFPEWDQAITSVFSLLTDEDEKMWLQQPLRHCLKEVLR